MEKHEKQRVRVVREGNLVVVVRLPLVAALPGVLHVATLPSAHVAHGPPIEGPTAPPHFCTNNMTAAEKNNVLCRIP